MIPAHAQNPAPVPAGQIPATPPRARPARRPAPSGPAPAVPGPVPRITPAVPPQTRPKANDPGTPHPSATPRRFRSSASWARQAPLPRRTRPARLLPRFSRAAPALLPRHSRPARLLPRFSSRASPPARLLPRVSSRASPPERFRPPPCSLGGARRRPPVPHHPYHAYLLHQLARHLALEQFNECGALPDRFGRVPHSLKVASRGAWPLGVGVDVRKMQRSRRSGRWRRGAGGRPLVRAVLPRRPCGIDSSSLILPYRMSPSWPQTRTRVRRGSQRTRNTRIAARRAQT
jgi:hypothetical protein